MYRRALERLAVVAAGETPSGEDTALATTEYASLYERLQNEKLVTWGSTADIPTWAETPIKEMLAFSMRGEFGLPADKLQEITAAASGAMATLRKQLENDEQTGPPCVEFF